MFFLLALLKSRSCHFEQLNSWLSALVFSPVCRSYFYKKCALSRLYFCKFEVVWGIGNTVPDNLWLAAFAILAMYYFGVSQGRFGDLEQNPNIFPNIPFDGSSLARQNQNRLKLNYYQLSEDDSETPVIIPSFERARTLRLWPSLRPIWKFRQCDKILTSNTSLCSSLSLETINHS